MSTRVPEANLAQVIGRVAAVIEGEQCATGERAALRRMSLDQPPPLIFYRFALRYLPEGWDSTEDLRRDWMTLVAGMARMSPNAHRPDQPFGKVLAEGGYSEARLERLLSAEGDTQRTLADAGGAVSSCQGGFLQLGSACTASVGASGRSARRVPPPYRQGLLLRN
jgi:CRISPR type I-E-associated protein CasB/Cse2